MATPPPNYRIGFTKRNRDAFDTLYTDLKAADGGKGFARETAGGDFSRTNRAMLRETELRTSPTRRADEFVERWNKLSAQAERAYVSGDLAGRKSAQNAMAGMAQSLERDPQMESILSARKAQLGISMETGRRLGAELAFNHGIDFGRGRDRSIGR